MQSISFRSEIVDVKRQLKAANTNMQSARDSGDEIAECKWRKEASEIRELLIQLLKNDSIHAGLSAPSSTGEY